MGRKYVSILNDTADRSERLDGLGKESRGVYSNKTIANLKKFFSNSSSQQQKIAVLVLQAL